MSTEQLSEQIYTAVLVFPVLRVVSQNGIALIHIKQHQFHLDTEVHSWF